MMNLTNKFVDSGLNVLTQDVLGRRSDERQLRMAREYPRVQMEGYRAAGINPFVAESEIAAAPTVNTPSASPMGESSAATLQALSSAKLNESQTKRNDQLNEETKANVKLLEEKAGLTHAEAVNANAHLNNIRAQYEHILATINFIRAQEKTEGYRQREINEHANVLQEEGANLRESRRKIIADGKISEFNLNYVLPLTAEHLRKDLHLKDKELRRMEFEIAKVANEASMGSFDLQIAAITMSDRLRKAIADSAREAEQAEQEKWTQSFSYGHSEDSGVAGDVEGVFRTVIQLLSYMMKDLADALPLGKVLGIDKIGNSGK